MKKPLKPSFGNLNALARLGQWVVACSVAAVIGYCCYLIAVPAEALFLLKREVPGIQTLPSPAIIFAAVCVAAMPIAAFLLALSQVWLFFGQVKGGHPYSTVAQLSLKWLGRAAFACAALGVLVRTIVGLLLSSSNPPGQKVLVIGVSSADIASLVIGILVFVFANVVREAAALAHENASFV
jgi:Protein of unknown function (DUF2975)